MNYPFAAIVGADDLALALILTTVSPDVGGVLVRGEKGTAKSTMVRALADVLPPQAVVPGCRFGCDPAIPDPTCPDGPHAHTHEAPESRPARLVELPVGATEDRVVGSLDLGQALGAGRVAFEPGLLAAAHRGVLYVDEVNLLHDHLVDLLLDAAAMGRNTVERDGVSVSHAARIVLVGTMNPEEGELRPQLLDRFGLTVEIAASRDPRQRVEVVRRRLAFDADPDGFVARYADAQAALATRLADASARLPQVRLSEEALTRIAVVCAGFDVDGMRADIVTARAARAHAAWQGRTDVTTEDIRVAARLALPHRRRRAPFDAPGLDEELLDRLLEQDLPDPPEPDPEPGGDGSDSPPEGPGGDDVPPEGPEPDADAADPVPEPPASGEDVPPRADQSDGPVDRADSSELPDPLPDEPETPDVPAPAPTGVASAATPYRAKLLTATGVGRGEAGQRSRAITSSGRTVAAVPLAHAAASGGGRRLHLPATITAAAPRQGARRAAGEARDRRVVLRAEDLHAPVTQGRESNLVLLAVDASGSMGARNRMREVKTAILSLLLDAYQRRDRVGLVTFRGTEGHLALPPTHSVEAAVQCLADLTHGGRTPLADGLVTAAHTLQVERVRDPRRRALLVLVTDGRATAAGPGGARAALDQARRIADAWHTTGVDAVVVDCETGRMRLGLAHDLAVRMRADYVPLGDVVAGDLVDVIHTARAASPAVLAAPAAVPPARPAPTRRRSVA